MEQKSFPNGFTSWMETHYEVVAFIENHLNLPDSMQKGTLISIAQEQRGHGGLYELSEELTDIFESQNKDRDWDGDFFDDINQFMSDINNLKIEFNGLQ